MSTKKVTCIELDAMHVDVDYSIPLMERPIEQLYYSVLTEEEKQKYTSDDLKRRFFELGGSNTMAVLAPLCMFNMINPNIENIIE